MAALFTRKPPIWFWAVTTLLFLWDLMGVWSWWEHWQNGPAAMGAAPSEYDVRYFAALPGWYVWLYALAVWAALIGTILLFARRQAARPVYAVSVVATVAMFAWNFLATDLIAAKGMWVTYFPAAIIALGLFAWWFAGLARRRGWLV